MQPKRSGRRVALRLLMIATWLILAIACFLSICRLAGVDWSLYRVYGHLETKLAILAGLGFALHTFIDWRLKRSARQ